MSKILLVGIKSIKGESIIEENVDEKILSKVIANVQAIQLKPILGKALYETVCDEATAKAVDSNYVIPEPTNELLYDYIQPFLIHAVVAEFIAINNYKISNKGVQKLNDNSSTSINANEVEYIKNYYDNYVLTYKNNLLKFIKDNELGVIGTDTNITQPSIGWFLDGHGSCYGDSDNYTSSNPRTETDPIWTADKPNYVPNIRTITINGVTFDLSANRSWTISAGGGNQTLQEVLTTGSELTDDNSITSITGKTLEINTTLSDNETSLILTPTSATFTNYTDSGSFGQLRIESSSAAIHGESSDGLTIGNIIAGAGGATMTALNPTSTNNLNVAASETHGFYYSGDLGEYYFPRTTPTDGYSLIAGAGGLLSWAAISTQWVNDTVGIHYNSGNVGIGVTDATSKLQVEGTFAVNVTNGNFEIDSSQRLITNFQNISEGTGYFELKAAGFQLLHNHNGSDASITGTEGVLNVNGSAGIIMSGLTSIGTGTTPIATLDVLGNVLVRQGDYTNTTYGFFKVDGYNGIASIGDVTGLVNNTFITLDDAATIITLNSIGGVNFTNGDLQMLGDAGTTGQVLTSNGPGFLPSWETISSASGTVTSVSVVSANGFAGTVATATSTPAITISTSITGLLKGNGTAISAAVSNTDYLPVASPTFTGTLSSLAGAINIGGNMTANIGLFASGVRAGNNTNFYWNSGPSMLGNTNDITLKNAGGTAGANVSIGTSAAVASAQLEITSTTKGFLPPRMTGTQGEAISSPAEGLMVYSTDGSGSVITSKGWWGYNGSAWVKLN